MDPGGRWGGREGKGHPCSDLSWLGERGGKEGGERGRGRKGVPILVEEGVLEGRGGREAEAGRGVLCPGLSWPGVGEGGVPRTC